MCSVESPWTGQEDWNESKPKGTFTTFGKTPEIGDPRVQFFVGWLCTAVGPFPVRVRPSMLRIIAQNGWPRLQDPEFGSAPNGCISNWICCNGAPASAMQPAGREPQAFCREVASSDSCHRPDSCCLAGGIAAAPRTVFAASDSPGLRLIPAATGDSLSLSRWLRERGGARLRVVGCWCLPPDRVIPGACGRERLRCG
jgi:hypothetical protein